VPGKNRITPAAHGDVQRRPGPSRIGHPGGETDVLDEALGLDDRRDRTSAFATPALIAILLDVRWDLRLRSHRGLRL